MIPALYGSGDEPAVSPSENAAGLKISSPERRVEFTNDAWEKLPRKSVMVNDRDGAVLEYAGILVSELLKLVGVELGGALRGPLLARYALVEAADGYRVVFSLPELDSDTTERVVLLADKCDGKPLDANEGPFRIVIPDEKRHARWVRRVTSITVREVPRPTADKKE